jgi:isopentenyldiphosphate isomerase
MELFDLVDQQDNVVGTTDKPTAHGVGQLHRVAAVYVFDQDGRLYVQVHKKSGGLYDNSVGGHVSQGETYEQAAYREAKEELGIDQPLQYHATFYSDEWPEIQHMFGLYSCTAKPDWRFEPNDEVTEIIPMAISDIKQLMAKSPELFTNGFINTMAKYEEITT